MAKYQNWKKRTTVSPESITLPEYLDQTSLESRPDLDIELMMAENPTEAVGSGSSAATGAQSPLFTPDQQAWIERLIANRTQSAPLATAAPTGLTNAAPSNPGNLGKGLS